MGGALMIVWTNEQGRVMGVLPDNHDCWREAQRVAELDGGQAHRVIDARPPGFRGPLDVVNGELVPHPALYPERQEKARRRRLVALHERRSAIESAQAAEGGDWSAELAEVDAAIAARSRSS